MAQRLALIVDDSRVARLALGRLLQQLGLAFDAADSAEAAMEYLRRHRPDVIFLDHMMPGMDGLEALRSIKADPVTGAIPVLMYTSKQNEEYVAQARALGAAAVLPKEVGPEELAENLRALHLFDEPRPQPVRAPSLSHLAPANEPVAAPTTGTPATPGSGPAPVPAPAASRPARTALVLAAVLAVALPWWVHHLYREATESQRLEVERAARTVSELAQRLEQAASGRGAPVPPATARLGRALTWALRTSGLYAWGEVPLDGERLETLRELAHRLAAAGLHGRILIHVHQGRFCLRRTPGGTLVPAAETAPATDCDPDALAAPPRLTRAQAMSVAFAEFLAALPESSGGRLQAEIRLHGDDSPRLSYPPVDPRTTAGTWNRIARRNNRVEFEVDVEEAPP